MKMLHIRNSKIGMSRLEELLLAGAVGFLGSAVVTFLQPSRWSFGIRWVHGSGGGGAGFRRERRVDGGATRRLWMALWCATWFCVWGVGPDAAPRRARGHAARGTHMPQPGSDSAPPVGAPRRSRVTSTVHALVVSALSLWTFVKDFDVWDGDFIWGGDLPIIRNTVALSAGYLAFDTLLCM
jgi:hypothetical protein